MSVTGTVKDGVVLLPPEACLPDGTRVEVAPLEPPLPDDPFLQAIARTARPRPHWPKDYALNHGAYVAGEPWKP